MGDRTVKVTLKGDANDLIAAVRRASAEVEKLNRQVGAFGKANPTARLGVDDSAAQRKVDKMRRQLAGLSDAKAKVDVDTAKADLELEAVNEGLDRVDGRRATANVNVNTSGAQRRMSLLMSSIVGLGPALVPISAGLVALGAGSLGTIGALGTAFGTAKLAATGLGDALKALNAVQDAQSKTVAAQATAQQNLAIAMSHLSSEGRNFAFFLSGLQPKLIALQAVAGRNLFPGLEAGLTRMQVLFPVVDRTIANVASELGRLAAEAGTALGDPQWRSFFAYIESEAAPTLDIFAHTLGNLATGFAGVVQAFGPLSRELGVGLRGLSQDFATWGQHLGASSALHQFVAYVEVNGPLVLSTLSSLGSAIMGIARAAAPIGPGILIGIKGLAEAIAALGNSPIGPTLVGIASGLAAITLALRGIEAVKSSKIAGLFRSIGQDGEKATSSLSKIGMIAGGPLAVGLTVGAMALGIWEQKQVEAKQRADDYAATLDDATAAITKNTSALAAQKLQQDGALQAAAALGVNTGDLVNAVLGNATAYGRVTSQARGYVASLKDQSNVTRANTGSLQDATQQHVRAGEAYANGKANLDKLLGSLGQEKGALQAGTAAKRATLVATNDATRASQQYETAQQREADAIVRATDALQKQNDVMHALADPVFALASALSAEGDAQGAAAKAIKEHGRDSVQARSALLDVATAALNVTDAAQKLRQGMATGAITTGKMSAMLAQWVQNGELTRTEAATLADELGVVIGQAGKLSRTPWTAHVNAEDTATAKLNKVDRLARQVDSRVSTVSVKTADTATANLNKVDRLARQLDGRVSTVSVRANTGQAISGLQSVKAWLNTIQSKTISVTTVQNIVRSGPGHVARAGGYAAGGTPHAGELAWVGERGPELMQFTAPTRIYNHADSVRIASRTGPIPGFAAGGLATPYNIGESWKMLSSGWGNADALTKQITAVQALTAHWDALVAAESNAAQRAQYVSAVRTAETAVLKKQSGAAKDLADAKKQLADYDRDQARQAAQTAIQNRIANAQARETLLTNQHAWAFSHMSAQQQIADLDRQMRAVKQYSDEWMQLAQQREQIAQQEADATKSTYDSALSNLNQLLDQRKSLLAQEAQAEQNYSEQVAQAQQQLADATTQALAARRQSILGFTQSTTGEWASSITGLISQTNSRTSQITQWSQGLSQLRGMGLSEQAIGQLGLDQSPAQMAQVLALTKATGDQIAQLNNSVAFEVRAAGAQVAVEQQGMLGDLGQSLITAQQSYHDAVAKAESDFQGQIADARDQLAALGVDQGRSYVDAVTQGIQSGLPGLVSAVQQVQASFQAYQSAQAHLTPAGAQPMNVQVFVGDKEITDIVDVRINQQSVAAAKTARRTVTK